MTTEQFDALSLLALVAVVAFVAVLKWVGLI